MQLDLFAERKGPATIYRFPLARRASLVRETAEELCRRSYADGRRYWSAHAQKLRKDLKAAGLSRTQIDAELDDYSRAVREHVFAVYPERMSR